MSNKINRIDEEISESELSSRGFTIENIVGTLDLNNEFDLLRVSEFLPNTEYEPETHPFLVYRPDNVQGTILLPTNGKSSLVGCKSKKEIKELGRHLTQILSEIAVNEIPSNSRIEIQNIVLQGNLEHELALPPIVVLLGMENAEYEPEQFPGVIYKPGDGTTALIFSSGKFMVNGATTYSQALNSVDNLMDKFKQGGVPGTYN